MEGNSTFTSEVTNASEQNIPTVIQETIFISYTHSDREVVHKVASLLKQKNQVWIDIDEIKDVEPLTRKIEEGIQKSSVVVCFISKKYVVSDNCRLEFFYANKIKKKCMYRGA